MSEEKIFITGGAGYVGSNLVPYLLSKGKKITVYDTMYFTDRFLPSGNPNLNVIKGDIRDSLQLYEACKDHDVFVNLACISNDASFELDERLSTSINLEAFEPMVLSAKKAGIKRFIYASSSSVYGVSSAKNVKEDHPLVPLTLYNKYKAECEPLLLKHLDDEFKGVIFRPATVCGYAPRMRLDLSVNILTNFAVNKNFINVFGGSQLRPNLHVQDYAEVVNLFLEAPIEKINGQIFNVGYENLSIYEIAKKVKNEVEHFNKLKNINIEITESNDNRSYHINSDKIFDILGYKAKRGISDATIEMISSFKKGLLKNSFEDDIFFNVKRIKNLSLK